MSQAVKQSLRRLEPSFPPGVELSLIVDVADTVQANLDRTLGTLRDAVVLVLLVLVLFLGRWRLAMIPGLAVPVALIGSLVLVRISGSNLNSLILFGLVLATGLVVDDAIVVVRHRRTHRAWRCPSAGRRRCHGPARGGAGHIACFGCGIHPGAADSRVGRTPLSTDHCHQRRDSVLHHQCLSFTPMACARVLGQAGVCLVRFAG